jgi:hypothetical protein
VDVDSRKERAFKSGNRVEGSARPRAGGHRSVHGFRWDLLHAPKFEDTPQLDPLGRKGKQETVTTLLRAPLPAGDGGLPPVRATRFRRRAYERDSLQPDADHCTDSFRWSMHRPRMRLRRQVAKIPFGNGDYADWDDIRMLLQAAGEQRHVLDWDLLLDYLQLFRLENRLVELKAIYGTVE